MKRLWMMVVVGICALDLGAQGANPLKDTRALRPQQATVQAESSEARTALIIGNGAYQSAPLKNPVQDARAMAEALRKCGFRVTLLENANRSHMVQAIREFGQTIQGGGVGLLYYAGHGMQVKGKNYLVPVDAELASEDEVPYNTLDADAVLAKMESARNRLNILILDACRNNPFGRSFRSSTQGLAQMDAPAGSYIAFATAPGHTAADGTGSHGLYTQYLLAQLTTPGLRVEDVFKRVRAGVMRDSKQQQVPWESSSITGDFYFLGGAVTEAPPPFLPGIVDTPIVPHVASLDPVSVPPPPSVQSITGNLQVAVTGAEARISLDGEFKGLAQPDAPLNLTRLPIGEFKVSAEAKGYVTEAKVVRVESGIWGQTALKLQRAQAIVIYRLNTGLANFYRFNEDDHNLYLDDRKFAVLRGHSFVRFEFPIGRFTLKADHAYRMNGQSLTGNPAILYLDSLPTPTRYFRLTSGGVGDPILTEVDEVTWQREAVQGGSKQVGAIR